MEKISIEQVVTDLQKMFKITQEREDGKYIFNDTIRDFHIHQNYFSSYKVVDMLRNYFKDKEIEDGYLFKIYAITPIYTQFSFKIIEEVEMYQK